MGRSYWFYPLIIGGVLLAFFAFKTAQKRIEEAKNKPFQEKYLKIYGLINSADKASAQKKDVEAKELYGEAFEQLSELGAEKPDWQPTIVKYRLKYLKEKLGLTPPVTASLSVPEIKGDIGYSENLVTEAQKGDVKAQMDLANCYRKGIGIEKNYEKAFQWWQKASEQENQDAEFRVAICFLQGEGVTRDEKAAFIRFLSLAKKDHIKAQFAVGNAYWDGLGVEKDELKAIEWYKKSAEKNFAEAQIRLGKAYQKGIGVSKSYSEAAKWFKKSADQGSAYGQFLIGNCYANGEGVEKNALKAIEYLKKADEQGYLDATFNLGYYYQTGLLGDKNQVEAIKYYKKCAEKNDFESANQLGNAYYYGQGIDKNYEQAALWYTKAAKGGIAKAQFHLGYMLEKGIGTQKDLEKAKYWYEKAAKKNDGEAQYALGNMYFSEKKYTKARNIYEEAQKNKVVLANEALIILKTVNLQQKGPLKNLANWGWYAVPLSLILGLILFSGWVYVFGKMAAASGIKIVGIIFGIAGLFNYVVGPLIFYKTIDVFQTKEILFCYIVVLILFFSGWIYAFSNQKVLKKGILLFIYFTGFLPLIAITASLFLVGYNFSPKVFSNYALFAWIFFLTTFFFGWASTIKIGQNINIVSEWKKILSAFFFSSFGGCVFLAAKLIFSEDASTISKTSICLLTIFLLLGIISSFEKLKPTLRTSCFYLSILWFFLMLFAGQKIITSQLNAISYVDAFNIMQSADMYFQEGKKLKANKKYQNALEKFQEILKKDPNWESKLIKHRIDEITKQSSISKGDSATNPQ